MSLSKCMVSNSHTGSVKKIGEIFTCPTHRLPLISTVIPVVYKWSFIPNKTTFTEYCRYQRSLGVRQSLVNLTTLAGIVRTTIYKYRVKFHRSWVWQIILFLTVLAGNDDTAPFILDSKGVDSHSSEMYNINLSHMISPDIYHTCETLFHTFHCEI